MCNINGESISLGEQPHYVFTLYARPDVFCISRPQFVTIKCTLTEVTEQQCSNHVKTDNFTGDNTNKLLNNNSMEKEKQQTCVRENFL